MVRACLQSLLLSSVLRTRPAGAKHLSMTVTRSKFEQLTDGLLNRTRQPCKDCLKDAGLAQSEITEVLLVGGMTRMPKVWMQSAN